MELEWEMVEWSGNKNREDVGLGPRREEVWPWWWLLNSTPFLDLILQPRSMEINNSNVLVSKIV